MVKAEKEKKTWMLQKYSNLVPYFTNIMIFKCKLLILNSILTNINNRDQRRWYHQIREHAGTNPSIMSVIIDGMDQNSTNLPHCKRIQMSDSNLWHFRTHLIGCIVHGHQSYVFLDFMQWPHDPNLTIQVLCQVISYSFNHTIFL